MSAIVRFPALGFAALIVALAGCAKKTEVPPVGQTMPESVSPDPEVGRSGSAETPAPEPAVAEASVDVAEPGRSPPEEDVGSETTSAPTADVGSPSAEPPLDDPDAETKRRVSGDGYRGLVFGSGHPVSLARNLGRWTPQDEDIARAEQLLSEQIGSLEVASDSVREELPEIARHLPEYRRRYYGFIDEQGNRSLQIWFGLVSESSARAWDEGRMAVLGGGSSFFTIVVDLSNGRCLDLRVNAPD